MSPGGDCRYTELLSAKTELSATVLDSEEERLAVSKALLDLKIENTQIRETAEAQVCTRVGLDAGHIPVRWKIRCGCA